jgi:malate permease and related proteins
MGERARQFLRRNPVLWVLVPALLTPSSAIPHAALEISHLAFLALVPVGFYILGVSLALPVAAGAESLVAPVGVAVLIRLALVPTLFAVGAGVLGRIPESYYIQASAPVGINSLIIASLFDLDRRLTATAIAITTGVALLGVVVAGAVR